MKQKDYLQLFSELPHISKDTLEPCPDFGYMPHLCHADSKWHVNWIDVNDNSLMSFSALLVEEAIQKAVDNWQSVLKKKRDALTVTVNIKPFNDSANFCNWNHELLRIQKESGIQDSALKQLSDYIKSLKYDYYSDALTNKLDTTVREMMRIYGGKFYDYDQVQFKYSFDEDSYKIQ